MSPSFITIYIFTLIIVGSIGVAVLKKYRDRQVNIRAEKKEDLKEESKTLSREDTRKPKKTEKIANKEKRDSKESSK
ncbi:unnamed protein product [Heligmosomoides polygyrus]|uniref:DUF2897 domain-containing protein n=1 Tax=Heligmosomoides polygyrus TaxID=6339 RepID=A0A183G053_HELPZ|nr:unnamed protein product [Heligmosomoides polygyrus]